MSWLLAARMSGTTCWILHLAQKIISCLLLIPALLLYLLCEEEVKTLDPPQQVQECSNARWVRSGGRTPSNSPVTTNPCCLPSSQPFLTLSLSLAFGLLSFPDGCNQLGLHFYEDSGLSPPKFLSLLVSMPTCTLNMGSFNKAPPSTDNRIQAKLSKISILVLIQYGSQHIFKLEIRL